jgi:hypothetical protein
VRLRWQEGGGWGAVSVLLYMQLALCLAGAVVIVTVTGILVFLLVSAMAAYVSYHNERFLLDAKHPTWQHYEPSKWWLLPHRVVGACALLLAPMQFLTAWRARYALLHRDLRRNRPRTARRLRLHLRPTGAQ